MRDKIGNKLEILKTKLATELSKDEICTALLCWDDYNWDDSHYPPIYGIKFSAIAYGINPATDPVKHKSKNKKHSPYEIELELDRLAAAANDLAVKLRSMSNECRELISSTSFIYNPLSCNEECSEKSHFNYSTITEWFEIERAHICDDGSIQEDELYFEMGNLRYKELIEIAEFIKIAAKKAQAMKQDRRGKRVTNSGRLYSLEWLMLNLGKIVMIQKRQMEHVIPIAQKIHEWATGEPLGKGGETAGKRSFDQIKAALRNKNHDNPSQIFEEKIKIIEKNNKYKEMDIRGNLLILMKGIINSRIKK